MEDLQKSVKHLPGAQKTESVTIPAPQPPGCRHAEGILFWDYITRFSGCLRGEDDFLVMVSEVEVILPYHIL